MLAVTLVLNMVIAVGKIAVGTLTGALAITADGFHSLMDGTANIAGLIANHFAAQPPDDDHPYGHRRFETLAALIIGALLLVTAWEILSSAWSRLNTPISPDITPMTFIVMGGTLIANVFISRYQIRRGKRLRSELLLADAANTRTDVFVTASVIVNMALVAVTGFVWLDLIAALIVVVLIGRAAWQVLNQTSRVLVDTAPYTADELSLLVTPLPNVHSIVRARSRGTLDSAHIDIDLVVPATMTVAQTATIRASIERCLYRQLQGISEVEVHFIPDMPRIDEDLPAILSA